VSREAIYPSRRGEPPPRAFFEPPRPAAGNRSFVLALGPLEIALERLDEAREHDLRSRFGEYERKQPAKRTEKDGALKVEVGIEDRAYFVSPPETPELNPVFLGFDADRTIRYLGYKAAGWIDPPNRRGTLLLAKGTYEPDVRAIENYVRVATAWMAVELGGALVHAASAVWQGKGYLFYGESGAGKSTLAESNKRARIVSDDLSLVLPDETGKLQLVGSPFRGTYEGGPAVHGMFPLAAGFRIIKSEEAKVEPVPRPRAFAELIGNLPFVAEALAERPEVLTQIQAAFGGVELGHLRFRKGEDEWWEAVGG
jgi:hypothetical protein